MNFLQEVKNNIVQFANKTAIIKCDNAIVLESLTYSEIEHCSKMILDHFAEIGIRKQCVALFMNHNVYIPSIILSLRILECPFIFLNPSHVQSSMSIMQRIKVKWIITLEGGNDELLEEALLNQTISFKYCELKLWKTCATEQDTYEDICYIIQTSGTTGPQKVIKVENYCIDSNVKSLLKILRLTSEDVIYFGTPLTFDPSIIELFLSMVTGSCLLLVPTKIRINPSRLVEALFPKNKFHQGVTFLQMPPSVFLRWSQEDVLYIFQESSLKHLALGGEKFPKHILETKRRKELKIYNFYGVTEVSCWASAFQVENCCDEVPLGKCLDDTMIEIRDEKHAKVADGVGEIYIGSYRRLCYLDDEEVRNQKPVFRSTGDMGRVKDEIIFYIGRKTDEIKRLGNRINLAHIEDIISKETKLLNASVWIEDLSKLVVFVVIPDYDHKTRKKVADKLRVKFLHVLPKECFPDSIEVVPKLPLTTHGKTNKSVLVNVFKNSLEIGTTKIQNPDNVFSNLWKTYFGIDDLNNYNHLNFFQMGGNSILAIQFISEFRDTLAIDYPKQLVSLLFEKTLEECLLYIKKNFGSCKRKTNPKESEKFEDFKQLKTIDGSITIEIKWKYDLRACVDSAASFISNGSSMLVAIGAFSKIFAVLDLESGNEIFKRVFPDSVENSSCVLPNGEQLFIGCHNGIMYCINVKNGDIIWEFQCKDVIKNKPCLCLKNAAIVFGSYDKFVYCLDVKKGVEIWKTFTDGCITSNPLYLEIHGCIYVASLSGICLCLSEIDGTELWKYVCDAPVFGSPCTLLTTENFSLVWPDVQGTLYSLSCLNGREIWKLGTSGQIYSSLTCCNKDILFTSKNHHLYCIGINNDSPFVKFKLNLHASSTTDPYLIEIESVLYILATTNDGWMFLVKHLTQEIVFKMKLPGETFSSPRGIGSNVIVGCRDNNIYYLQIKKVDAYRFVLFYLQGVIFKKDNVYF